MLFRSGLSRKGFVGKLLAASDERAQRPSLAEIAPPEAGRVVGVGAAFGETDLHAATDATPPVAVDDRIEGSVAFATWAALRGVGMIRAHDVRATVDAVTLVGEAV